MIFNQTWYQTLLKCETFAAMGYVAVIYKNIADILPTKSER